MALLLALVLIGAGCSNSDGSLNPERGNVMISLTSEPSPALAAATTHDDDDDHDRPDHDDDITRRLAEVNVTFSSFLARNLDGQLIDLSTRLPRTVNMIPIVRGGSLDLPMGTLPAGSYDQLVVVMTDVEYVFLDGGKIKITPPGGGWTSIVAVCPFEVTEGEVTTIKLRFRPRDAFRQEGGEMRFHPSFTCDTRD
jgi:hypothetical protein